MPHIIDKDGHGMKHDGERGADDKLMNLIRKLQAKNVSVVVSRWVGEGAHLGYERYKIMLDVA